MLNQKAKPQTIKLPAFESLIKADWEDAISKKVIDKNTNFNAKPEIETCLKCNGTGIDKDGEKCLSCEGTGVQYLIHYGVQDGNVWTRVECFGMDALKEMCRLYRQASLERSLSGKKKDSLGYRPFIMPLFLRFELEAHGFDVDGILDEGDSNGVREMARYVQKHFPDLMTTHYKNI